jgi:hypothetical protein
MYDSIVFLDIIYRILKAAIYQAGENIKRELISDKNRYQKRINIR